MKNYYDKFWEDENFGYFSDNRSVNFGLSQRQNKIPDKYISGIFDYNPEKESNFKSTKQEDYGNYLEKKKLQELKILKNSQIPAKNTNSF